MRCLDYLVLCDEVEAIGYRHGDLDHTFRLWSTNEIIPSELGYPLPGLKHQMSRFARVDLHKLLISKLPPGSVHLKKKVVAVETPHDGDVRVSFADGTSWTGDAVVGADGIRSAVRQHFVPDYELDHGQLLALREVFPRSLLDGIDDVPLGSCHYMGPDLGFFFSPISKCLALPLSVLPDSTNLPPLCHTSTAYKPGSVNLFHLGAQIRASLAWPRPLLLFASPAHEQTKTASPSSRTSRSTFFPPHTPTTRSATGPSPPMSLC